MRRNENRTSAEVSRGVARAFLKASFPRQLMCAALVGTCFSGTVAGLIVSYAYASVVPRQTGNLLPALQLLLGSVFLAPLAAVPLALVTGLLTKKAIRLTVLAIVCCVIHFPLIGWGMRCGNTIRTEAFERLARRSKPLVDAVRAFEQRAGHPPRSLAELVPDYLAEVPQTGLGLYPEYHYMAGPEVRTGYYDNPWVLLVPCPSGLLNWDTFLYFPNQQYPETGYGGSLERLGNWAYVHE